MCNHIWLKIAQKFAKNRKKMLLQNSTWFSRGLAKKPCRSTRGEGVSKMSKIASTWFMNDPFRKKLRFGTFCNFKLFFFEDFNLILIWEKTTSEILTLFEACLACFKDVPEYWKNHQHQYPKLQSAARKAIFGRAMNRISPIGIWEQQRPKPRCANLVASRALKPFWMSLSFFCRWSFLETVLEQFWKDCWALLLLLYKFWCTLWFKVEIFKIFKIIPKLFQDSLQKRPSTEKRQVHRRPKPSLDIS